ncbi:hypothetical protein FNF31_05253 [Cafeteria roenbergensis]|uniref:Cytochrome P450 n=1 Tax=Cafeteria roenbergensis TaxID=33653 RepID=A0A5A8D272_CAFRO|nr:hypothetical protein FNF31_05253 [Cafeteria roenbergensis]KAA0159495.1 hypothetical protein FNF28_05852 [Cafeteria roenbergensis]
MAAQMLDVDALWHQLQASPPLMYATAGVAVLVLILSVILLRDTIMACRVSAVPGPAALPFVGHIPFLLSEPWNRFGEWARKYGDIYKIFIWGTPMVIVSSPELVKHILRDARDRFPKDNWSYSFFGPILGEGLVTASGASWAKQNQALKPKFKHAALRQYMRAFTGAASRLREAWAAMPSGSVVELDSTFRQVTLEVIAEVSLGLTPADASVLPELFGEIIDELNQRMWKPWRAFMPGEITHQRRIRELNDIVLGLIRKRKQEYAEAEGIPAGRRVLDEDEVLAAGASVDTAPRGGDFLDIMLQSESEFTDTEMLDELKTMLMAGHETTAMMLTWCTFLLAKHPDEMRKAVAEVDAAWEASGVDGPKDGKLGWAGIDRMTKDSDASGAPVDTYLHYALHEAMRIYTPVPVLAKCTRDEGEVLGGAPLPAGTKVMLCCVALHSDPKLWGSDVQAFRPERHRGSEHRKLPGKLYPFTFIPFSQGRRECVGRRLALVEAKTILSYMLRDFEITLAPGQTAEPRTDCYMMPLRPEGGMRVQIKPRVRH